MIIDPPWPFSTSGCIPSWPITTALAYQADVVLDSIGLLQELAELRAEVKRLKDRYEPTPPEPGTWAYVKGSQWGHTWHIANRGDRQSLCGRVHGRRLQDTWEQTWYFPSRPPKKVCSICLKHLTA